MGISYPQFVGPLHTIGPVSQFFPWKRCPLSASMVLQSPGFGPPSTFQFALQFPVHLLISVFYMEEPVLCCVVFDILLQVNSSQSFGYFSIRSARWQLLNMLVQTQIPTKAHFPATVSTSTLFSTFLIFPTQQSPIFWGCKSNYTHFKAKLRFCFVFLMKCRLLSWPHRNCQELGYLLPSCSSCIEAPLLTVPCSHWPVVSASCFCCFDLGSFWLLLCMAGPLLLYSQLLGKPFIHCP